MTNLGSPNPIPAKADWTGVTYANGWADYGAGYVPGRFHVLTSGRVLVEGVSSAPVLKSGAAFLLPLGPEAGSLVFPAVANNLGAAFVQVDPDGTVTLKGALGVTVNTFCCYSFSFDSNS